MDMQTTTNVDEVHESKETKTTTTQPQPILPANESTAPLRASSIAKKKNTNKFNNNDQMISVSPDNNDMKSEGVNPLSTSPTKNTLTQPRTKKARRSKKSSQKKEAEAFLMGISFGGETEKRDKDKKKEPEFEDDPTVEAEDNELADPENRDNKLKKQKQKEKQKLLKSSGILTQRQLPLPPEETSLRSSKSLKKLGKHGIPYAHLLPIHETYDPEFLDNHTTVPLKEKISIDLPGYKESFLPFMKPTKLKEQLDLEFREKHRDWLTTNINLSDIRSVKNKIFRIALKLSLDSVSVALSYVFFEKLVLKNLVNKSNYKQYAAACLLLAVKFNEGIKNTIQKLLTIMPKYLVSSKEVLNVEFTVFKELNFELYVEMNELLPHLRRLQSSEDYQDSLLK